MAAYHARGMRPGGRSAVAGRRYDEWEVQRWRISAPLSAGCG